MIAIVPIFNLISFAICILISLRLYFSYRREKSKKLEYFFKSFSFLGTYFLLLALPLFFPNNLMLIGLILALSVFFLCLTLAYFICIPLEIIQWERLKRTYFWGLIIFAFLITIFNLFNLESAEVHLWDQFIFFEDARSLIINIVIGFITGIATISAAVFFFVSGFKIKQKYLRSRAFIIGGGILIMAVAGMVNYIPGASSHVFTTSVAASLLAITGLLTILAGIYYKKEIYF